MGCLFRRDSLACGTQKMIPISPRNGEVSEKAGSGSRGDGFWGLGKSGWKPLAVSRRRYWAGSAQLKANGFILTSRRVKKLIPVSAQVKWKCEIPVRGTAWLESVCHPELSPNALPRRV